MLRTEPNVRFAAIFGSVARGDESEASDLDVAIDFEKRDRRGRIRLANKMEAASGRRVQLVHLGDVEECAPDLLGEIVVEGRVLVDRDGRWPGFMRRRRQILERARDARRELLTTERTAISKFERESTSA
ncbi:MAG: nucleotidyltransferase domain-containing protein [Solirubrobacterales bacterium]